MVNKKVRFFFKIGISCFFAGWVLFKVDLHQVFSSFKEINLSLYIASTVLALVTSIILACKYCLLIRDTEISHTVLSLTRINLISRFYAMFLPSAIGRAAVRWYKVTRNLKGRALFAASIVFERITFVFVLLIFSFIPLFLYSSRPAIESFRSQVLPVFIGSFVVVCLSFSYYVFSGLRALINSMVARILSWQWKQEDTKAYLDGFSLNRPGPSLYVNILSLSFLFQVCFILRLLLLFKGAAIPLTLLDVAWMGSLVLLLQVLPISFAGIGIREGAYAYLFTIFGLPPEKGVLIGILFFSQMLILAGTGGILEMLEK